LVQDELLIRNRLAIGDGNEAELELDVNGKVTKIPLAKVVENLTAGKEVIDFVTSGSAGTVLKAKDRIAFVQTSRTDDRDRDVGEVSIGYFGLDTAVTTPDQVIIRNSGTKGAKMRALIVYE
jgi:hypothetical protein